MKKLFIYSCIMTILLFLPFLSACHASDVTTVPITTTILSVPELPTFAVLIPTVDRPSSNQTKEAADDILTVPGGAAYRANVHETGVPDKWPSISLAFMLLENGFDNLNVNYRNSIKTKAGEARYNIINASIDISNSDTPPANHQLTLYSMSALGSITLGVFGGGGIPGTSKAVLTIDIPRNATLGEHSFDIGIVFDGVYFGAIPCTVNVVK